jgi:acetyl-CoA carboxylase, biotin carboxylase subunit
MSTAVDLRQKADLEGERTGHMFNRVLIANRGEIALRVIRACREMGIETVAVYSEEDRNASYLRLATRSICIGAGAPSDSYLKSDRIIAAAEISNVDAIHPGYGFLAENPQFAEQCRESKIEFIGPSAESMRLMGNKIEAKRLAKTARVATVPWSQDPVESEDEAALVADKIGYPVMLKAAAGGGGRGIRVCHNEATLRGSFSQARSEAEAGFKDPTIYLEKLIERPRHIEVQVLGDLAGNVIHLFERDCSLQRRHQKLVEESPAPGISNRTREELCKAAVRLARAANYHSAGTVEFLVDEQEEFYFIEMNARIQVEHPVTEMVTGVDLVKWQIRLAGGETIGVKQRDIKREGVAIEARINAENPEDGFRPCPGLVERFIAPGGFGVRFDSHVHAGYRIGSKYDSLIGKLIVHKKTREEAIACMRRCLDEFEIGPIKTTIPLHQKIFSHACFQKGQVDTGFIERTW